MFFAFAFTLLAAVFVHADPDPETSPGDVFIVGQSCPISWKADTTGVWKNMTISIMTGDNYEMVFLATVATLDGTDPTTTTFSYPCPLVMPFSNIYFYQFSSSASTNSVWTGRFTITDNASNIVPPANSAQSDGQAIPWGTGQLVNTTSTASNFSTTTASYTPSASLASSSLGPALAVSPTSSITSHTSSSWASSPSLNVQHATVVTSTSTASPSSSVAGQTATGTGLSLYAQTYSWKTALALGVSALGFVLVL